MLRLIHNQTISGAILVDDIDDGLPNKEVHRLGSLGDPKAYERDGYANKPKQQCYLPFSHTAPNGSITPGFITVQQTNAVTLSQGKGKIFKLSSTPPSTLPGAVNYPLVTLVTGITLAQLATGVITAAAHGPPTSITNSSGNGTFVSVTPDITYVTFAQGTGATLPVTRYGGQTLTSAQIIADGGTVAATAISIAAASFTGGPSVAPVLNNTVFVTANEKNSNTFPLS